ncbi:MAG: hypothetical protein IH984_01965 [Planctomycetes bacterium]|nr:hypothetical protein [Planctomycetota bacterium]
MITRKISKLIRGNTTPMQIMLATILGSMLGFIPSFAQGAGLVVLLVILLVILNANLFVATMTGLAAKAISLALLPVTFLVGRALLDGPTQPLFKAMINAPVLALFGLEYYVTTGGIVMGALVGIVAGILLKRSLSGFRKQMAKLEEGSPKFTQITSTWWAKLLIFVFIGKGHGKQTYQELLDRKAGNPIRPVGVVVAVMLIALCVVALQFARGPIFMNMLRSSLERANGATVDMQDAKLDIAEGKLEITGFAMADPNNLQTDLLRATRIEADISGADLLRKRIAIDRLVMVDASHGEKRATPGNIVGKAPTPPDSDVDEGDETSGGLEDYIQKAQQWKQRLAQIRKWLEKMSGPGDADDETQDETLKERLARQIAEQGYSRVQADHLIDGSPTFSIYELIAKGVTTPRLENETLEILGTNLSTHPHLLDKAPTLTIKSSSKTIEVDIKLPGGEVVKGTLLVSLSNLSADKIAQELIFAGTPLMKGGTIDVLAKGSWSRGAGGTIDLPLTTTIRNTKLSIAGRGEVDIKELIIPIAVSGTLDNPRITIEEKALTDALVKAGASKLTAELKGKLDDKLKDSGIKLPGDLGKDLEGAGDAFKKGLGGLFGGGKKDKDD